MRRRHPPLPMLWLMTDERMGDALWSALNRLSAGSGVIFRHYSLPLRARRLLFAQVRKVARRRRLILLRAGPMRFCGEDGTHGTRRREGAIYTRAAHSRADAVVAIRAGADAIFASPIFATRSHPGAASLGRARFGLMIRELHVPVIALGGMDAKRAASLQQIGIYGWAAIDAWTR